MCQQQSATSDCKKREAKRKSLALIIHNTKLQDGTRVTVEITNKDTGWRYMARLAVTSDGELYIPVGIQKMMEDADCIRVTLL